MAYASKIPPNYLFWEKRGLFYFHCFTELKPWTFFHPLVMKIYPAEKIVMYSMKFPIMNNLLFKTQNKYWSRVSASNNLKKYSYVSSFLYIQLHMYYIRTVIHKGVKISLSSWGLTSEILYCTYIDLPKIKEGTNMARFPSPYILKVDGNEKRGGSGRRQ